MGTKQFDNYADLITFTRASGGTALRPISYGSELVTNGTFDTDVSGWTAVNSTLSLSSNALSVADAGQFSAAYQAISTEIGKAYRLSLDCVSKTGGDFKYGWGDAIPDGATYYAQNQVTQTVSGSYTLDFVAVSTTTYISVGSQSNDAAVYDNISVKEVLFDQPNAPLTLFNHPTNIPRIEYDADGNRLGLLIEEQRTNLLTYSENFASADSQGVTFSAAVNPTGTVNNCKVITNSGEVIPASSKRVTRSESDVGDTDTASIFAKAAEYDSIVIEAYANNNSGRYVKAIFDLANGTVATSQGGDATWFSGFSASISEAGNGWYRCSITYTVESSVTFARIYFGPADSTATTGDGFSGVLMFGAQLEAGSFPTSYIPTSGSTATRAADVASIPTSAFGYNASEGTLFVEASVLSDQNADDRRILEISDGTTSNFFSFYQDVSAGENIFIANQSGGSLTANFNTGFTITEGSTFKAVATLKDNDVAASVNGGSITSDTSTAISSALSEVNIGYLGGGTQHLNGHIKSIKYYPRRLSNAQLQELTQ